MTFGSRPIDLRESRFRVRAGSCSQAHKLSNALFVLVLGFQAKFLYDFFLTCLL